MLFALTLALVAAFSAQVPSGQAPPPTLAISCAANPSTVAAGSDATIAATGFSAQNRHMSYSFKATSGTVTPAGPSAATLHTLPSSPATITVTCNVVDDRGNQASKTVTVNVSRP